jgi:sialate O-acetylesterase
VAPKAPQVRIGPTKAQEKVDAMFRKMILACLLPALLIGGVAMAADAKKAMPKEDVVDVPAIGEGLCVSNAFQTNMVLQRDKDLKVWGWASAGDEVAVSFAGQQVQAKAAADRSWQVTLKAMPANSAPQTMTIKAASKTLTLENILVGDVWLLGGQSNMEWPITNVDDGMLEVVSANFPQIRLLTMPGGKGFKSVRSFERLYEWSDWSSRHFRKGDWDVCTPETVKEFSAIGYVFGRRLAMAAGVPIGLIDASAGGTTVETWTPEDVLRKIDGKETREMLKEWDDKIAAFDPQADLKKRIDSYNANKEKGKEKGKNKTAPTDVRPGPAGDKNRPGCRYASVIKPLTGLVIKGAAFHQGFNNCFNGSAGARMYYQVFGKMIAAWRGTFGDPQMPFCIISLCTAGEPQTRENYLVPTYDVGALIREAQYKTFRDLYDAGDKNIGFASSFDLRKSFYHPQIKIPVGERAAKWALVTQYGLITGRDADEYWLPPSIKEVKIADGTIRLTMSTAIKMKDESEDKLAGFAIAGKDRRFYPANVDWYSDGTKDDRNRPVYSKNILVLSSPFVAEPVAYRYAWARNPIANITNGRQVPIAAQRNDDWILEETPEKIATPENMTEDAARRSVAGQIRKELELADTERRIKEAEATIAQLKPVVEKAKADAEKKKADAEKRKADEAKKAAKAATE